MKIKLLIFALIGCLILAGCQATSQSTYYNEQIMAMVGMVVDCLDNNDADGLIGLFEEIDIEYQDNLIDFVNSYSHSQNTIVDCGSYLKESEKIEGRSCVKYSGVSAIVSTNDDIYTLFIKFRYNKQDDEYTLLQLKIISGKSEAYENFDFYNEDNYNDDDVFLFVDDYDRAFDELEGYPTYQTIFGLVLASRGKSKALDIDEANDLVSKNLTKEGLVEEIGEPLAYVEKVLTYYYYVNADDENTFIMFKIGKDGNVASCKEVSDKYTGWLNLDFCGK